jgi:hypothetical protein
MQTPNIQEPQQPAIDWDQAEALETAGRKSATREEALAEAREAKPQYAQEVDQEKREKEKRIEEMFLPAEREERKWDGRHWVGNIRYERSSGQYLTFVCDENTGSGVWVKAGVAEARRFLTNEGLRTKKEIEAEGERERRNGNIPRCRELRYEEPLEYVLELIRKFVVDTSGPRAGYTAGRILNQNGEIFLVTTSPTLIEPKEGEFPTIARLLNGLFPEEKPRSIFLAWLKDAVKSLHLGELNTGKLLVTVGRCQRRSENPVNSPVCKPDTGR